MDDKVLEHIGVLGMHWGHRKTSPDSPAMIRIKGQLQPKTRSVQGKPVQVDQRGRNIPTPSKPSATSTVSEDHLRTALLKKKKISEMSNDEIRKLSERMQLEKQYKDVSNAQVSEGQKAVKEVLMNSAKQAAAPFVQKAITKLITVAITYAMKTAMHDKSGSKSPIDYDALQQKMETDLINIRPDPGFSI